VSGNGSVLGDRTRRYTGGVEPTIAAGVATGPDTAATSVGQVAVLSAVNMLARAHPAIVLDLPDTPLIVSSPTGGATLAQACEQLAREANPRISLPATPCDRAPVLSIGIGEDTPRASVYAGGARFTARTGASPQTLSQDASTLVGSGMAVALAAGYVFRTALAMPAVIERSISLWTLQETSDSTGPDACGPVDIGEVWMIGAGAVGSGLAWWLHHAGVTGKWIIIDGDLVEVSNLNRSLGLFAHHAGLTGLPPALKAEAAAELIPGAHAFPHWWEDWAATDPASPDVLLPLANERTVRPAIAAYSHPATLHASTSPNWTAELHRHLIGRDDCIACRLPDIGTPTFVCATAPTDSPTNDEQEPRTDAALPFLSGAAGLLALAGLLQLQHGQWTTHQRNHWRTWFDQTPPAISHTRYACARTCAATAPSQLRCSLHGATRWRHLDPAVSP
jgi:molybdopterin/thiamine biosynthesis adenylyltransferase